MSGDVHEAPREPKCICTFADSRDMCPVCRYRAEVQVEKIRAGLRSRGYAMGGYDGISMSCWSREEADEIKALLTDEERAVVRFTWIMWPP